MSLKHLEEKSPFGEYIKTIVGFADQGQTLVALPDDSAHYVPATINTISLNPQNSSISSALIGSSSIDFQISSGMSDIDVVKSVYIDFTITNTSAVDPLLITPTPFMFSSVQFLPKLPDSAYAEDEHSHLALLYCMNREQAHYIIERENFIDLEAQDQTDFIQGTAADLAVVANYPSLCVNNPIPPLGSRKLRYYMLGGPLLARGFATGLLRNQQDVTIRYFFKQTSQWCNLPANIGISTPRLQLTGLKVSPIFRSMFADAIAASNAVCIPYTSWINDVRRAQSFTAGSQNTFVLTNTKALASFLFSYVRANNPNGTNLTSQSRYVQDSAPKTLSLNLTANTATVSAGNWGGAYALENWSLKPSGGLSSIISDQTKSSEISELFQAANGYRSYLAAEYKSLYMIPLGSMINPDISRITYSAGITYVDNTFTISFETLGNVADGQYITVIGAASVLVVDKENVFHKIL